MLKFQKRDNAESGFRDIQVAKIQVENEDTFHLKNLYKLIHDWLDEEGFVDIYGTRDNPETFYLERISGSGSKEHRIRWRCIRTQ